MGSQSASRRHTERTKQNILLSLALSFFEADEMNVVESGELEKAVVDGGGGIKVPSQPEGA